MPDNQGLSHLSDHLLIVAVVLYSLAVIAFAADFAFGRRSPVVSRAGAGVRHRVPAAVGAGGAALDGGGGGRGAAGRACATGYPRQSGREPRRWTVTGRTAQRWTARTWTAPRWPVAAWPVAAWLVVR